MESSEDSKYNSQTRSKPLIEEPLEFELKNLPSHLECAFLESSSKLPVIITSDLDGRQKDNLLEMPKWHKKAIVWKIAYTQGISPSFCTDKSLMEHYVLPSVQPHRILNLNMKEVAKAEVKSC